MTLNLAEGSDDQTRGFSFKAKILLAWLGLRAGKSIGRHAPQNWTCILAKSDYLKLQIPDTRFQPPGTASMTPIRAGG
jgi:hypothetical protein